MTCSAPSDFSKAACYSFLTIFKRGIPSVLQYLFSILPKAEAAAVWIIPFFPAVLLYLSIIPITVKGFTTPEAADVKSTSSSIAKALFGTVVVYYPHVPTPAVVKETLFPTQCWRSSPLASTTCPVPYNPIVAGRATGK
jgi:hypothetical protein